MERNERRIEIETAWTKQKCVTPEAEVFSPIIFSPKRRKKRRQLTRRKTFKRDANQTDLKRKERNNQKILLVSCLIQEKKRNDANGIRDEANSHVKSTKTWSRMIITMETTFTFSLAHYLVLQKEGKRENNYQWGKLNTKLKLF